MRLCYLCELCGELLVGSGKVKPLESPAAQDIAKEVKSHIKPAKLKPLIEKREKESRAKPKIKYKQKPQQDRGIHSRMIQFWINPIQYAMLVEEAANEDRSIAYIVRRLINKHLGIGSSENKYDLSQESQKELRHEHDSSQQSEHTEET